METYRNALESATDWDTFAVEDVDGGFLQSRTWGRFQERLGRRVAYVRLADCGLRIVPPSRDLPPAGGVTDCGDAQALGVEHRLPGGFSYVYSPRGPIVNAELGMKNYELRDAIGALALEVHRRFPKAIFWRIEPPVPPTDNLQLTTYNLVRAPRDVQPRTTLVIDVTRSDDELLRAMKQKTRYNIRTAERHGVTVRTSERPEDLEKFLGLLSETARRDGFTAHAPDYYRAMFAALSPDYLQIFLAERDGTLLASALVAFNRPPLQTDNVQLKTDNPHAWCYYLHGASSSDDRALMAPYALHWEIMRAAKARGCTRYDLWGIDPARWPGVTRFKEGFAPNTKPTAYAGAWDVVFRPTLYWVYRRLR